MVFIIKWYFYCTLVLDFRIQIKNYFGFLTVIFTIYSFIICKKSLLTLVFEGFFYENELND